MLFPFPHLSVACPINNVGEIIKTNRFNDGEFSGASFKMVETLSYFEHNYPFSTLPDTTEGQNFRIIIID